MFEKESDMYGSQSDAWSAVCLLFHLLATNHLIDLCSFFEKEFDDGISDEAARVDVLLGLAIGPFVARMTRMVGDQRERLRGR